MATFDSNKYKQLFENRFGSGSYDSGVSRARDVGRLKVQAKLARDLYEERRTAAEEKAKKKTYQDAVNEWKTSSIDNPDKLAEEIRNNPYRQEELSEKGYAVDEYIDGMFNAWSGGRYRSEREYKQKNKAREERNGMTNEDLLKTLPKTEYAQAQEKKKKTTNKEKKKENNVGILSDIGRAGKNFFQAVNPLDDVSFKEAFKNNVDDALSTERGKGTKEATRGLTRIANTGTLGLLDEAYKRTNDGQRASQFTNENRGTLGKVADFGYDATGYLLPGLASANLLRGTKLGADLTKTGLSKVGQLGKEGAVTGLGMGLAEVGIREGLNKNDYSAKQNLSHIGLSTVLGGVGDPALYGAGKLATKGFQTGLRKALPQVGGDFPKFNGQVSNDLVNRLQPKSIQPQPISSPKFNNLMPDNFNTPNGQSVPLSRPNIGNELNIQPQQPSFNRLQNLQQQAPMPNRLQAGQGFEPIESAPRGYNGTEEPGLIRISAKERADQLINNAKQNRNFSDLPDTMGQIVSKTDKEPVPVKQRANQAYINNVDNEFRLKQFTDEARAKGEVKPEEDPYMIALNSRGADQVSKQIVVENMVNHKGETVGPSLKEISKKLPKDTKELKTIEDYMINKHAITRMDRGEKVFQDGLEMTAEKAAAKVAKYELDNPSIAQQAKELYDFDTKLAKTWLVDTGVLPKDVWEGYLENNPYYVSNERLFAEVEKSNVMNQANRGLANQSNPIKKGVGSQRKIVSPMETRIERVAKYVKTAKRNETMQALIKQLQKDPETFKGWAEIVPTDKGVMSYWDSLGEKVGKDGLESVLNDFNKNFDQKPDLTLGNVVAGIVDGKKVHVKVNDPQLLDALSNLQPAAQEGAIKVVGQITRMMKTLTTGINPMFTLLRNVWRDIPQSYIASKTTSNPVKFTTDLVGSMVDVFGNKEAYKAFKAIGGGHSSPISADANLLDQSKRAILGTKGFKSGVDKMISGIENLSNIVEAAPRLAEYKRLTKNDNSYGNKIKGLYEANDITVNFNRHGNNVKQLDAFIPYLNAAVQGLDKFGRIYKDNPVAATAKTTLAITLPSFAAMAWNYKNDWEGYKSLPSYVRDTNLLISVGDGQFVKIPRPREIGIIFGALPERMLLKLADEDPKAFEGFSDSLITAFFPPTRLITAPLDDIRANKSFADIPIVPGNLERLSPRYQYDETTSAPSKAIGNLLNVSPKELDYLAKSYTGVLGQLGIPMFSEGSTVGNTLKKQVVADSVYQNSSINQFYDTKDKLETANNDFKAVGVQGEDYNNSLRKQFNKIADNMSNVRKQMQVIENNDSLSDDEKLKKLRDLQKQLNQLAGQGNQMKEGVQ